MDKLIYLVPVMGAIGLLYTFIKFSWVSKQDPGTERMQEISRYIAEGAMAFLKAEWKILSEAANGPDYLASETIPYVKANLTDLRAAEALALVVRATHLGTTDERTGPLSKQAFDLLHLKYPDTTYARNTKYWYK